MELRWDDIRYFLALAREQNLSAAARTLRVEHSTVARRVAAMEASLGSKLFNRLPRGWVLTDEGNALVPFAQGVEAETLVLTRRGKSGDVARGIVRISAPPILVSHWLTRSLHALCDQHPELDFDLVADRGESNLPRGEADIALRVGKGARHLGLVSKALGAVGYGLYGTPGHVKRKAADQVFVGFDTAMAGSAQKQWLDDFAAERRVVFRSNDLAVLHQAAMVGWGIALLPHFLVTAADGLRQCDVSGKQFERPLSLLMHADLRRSQRVRVVADFLIARATEQRSYLLQGRVPSR
jgi:DNA-binding transcriptional LysR family regulator